MRKAMIRSRQSAVYQRSRHRCAERTDQVMNVFFFILI